jgi:hypothetical protein
MLAAHAQEAPAQAAAVQMEGLDIVIDWFIHEPVESAHKLRDGKCEALTDADWDKIAIRDGNEALSHPTLGKYVCVGAPLGRFRAHLREFVLPVPATLRQLVEAVLAFYASPATVADLEATGGGDSSQPFTYASDVSDRLSGGGAAQNRS